MMVGMKKTKEDTAMRKFMILLAALALVSCAKEQNIPEEVVPQEPETTLQHMTFTGVTDDGLTKTTLDTSDWGIDWSTSDHIAVLAGDDDDTPADFQAQSAGRVTTFSGTSEAVTDYYAVFPYNAAFTTVGGKINASLPTSVAAVEGSFGANANLSVAKSTGTNNTFEFKNVGALVGVTVGQDDITGIKLEAIGGEKLSGNVTVNSDGTLVSKDSGVSLSLIHI